MKKDRAKMYEIIGWYGPVAFITAHFLVSFDIVSGMSYLYQILCLTGGISIIVISLYKKVFQSVVLNGFFVIISLITIIRLIMGWF